MRYLTRSLDLDASLPALTLADDEHGVALVLRRAHRFVAYVLREFPPGTVLTAAAVNTLVAESAGARSPVVPSSGSQPVPAQLPSLTAAVNTRDRTAQLERCLASLLALRASPWARRLQFEILVVDNAPSDDGTRELVGRLPEVRYVREPKPGLDFARNVALREATGEVVAFFDDDVVVDDRWLDGFVEAWCEHPDAAAITGPVIAWELVTPAQIVFERWGGLGHRFEKRRFGPTLAGNDLYPCQPGPFGSGCNMALRKDVVLELGGFDEALDTGAPLAGGGDLDILYRIVRTGQPLIVEPQCLVFHQHRREHMQLRHQMWSWGLGTMAYVAKSYRSDPSQRAVFRRLVARWFRHTGANVLMCTIGRGGRPMDLALAQLAGGVVGILGGYQRSVRRVARIRRRYGQAAPAGAKASASVASATVEAEASEAGAQRSPIAVS